MAAPDRIRLTAVWTDRIEEEMSQEKYQLEKGLDLLKKEFGEESVARAVAAVSTWQVEVPSWAFGSFGGGRFSGYTPPGAARTIEEKLDDAAFVHRLTGTAGSVSTHVLWDFSRDGLHADYSLAREVFEAARQRGLKLGSVNPTYFLSGFHRGSLTSPEEKTRQRAIEQTQIAGRIAAELGQGVLSLWFPDGSLYPGQVELRHAYERMRDGLVESLRDVPPTVTVLLEYKLFEPGTYSTVIPDWGTAFLLARHVGRQAGVLVDLGHHPHGTNIEQIVAVLRSEGLPGGFHFNTRYAADDDQAVEPNPELARIFYELLLEEGSGIFPENWTFMLDQASSRENRIEAILHSIDSLQTALARACLVNRKILHQFQRQDDIIAATRFFNQALLQADVRPVLYQARSSRDLPLDPVMAYKASGYQTRIEARRV